MSDQASIRFFLLKLLPLLAALGCVSLPLYGQQGQQSGTPENSPTIVRLKAYAGEQLDRPVTVFQGFVVEGDGMVLTSYQPLVNAATAALHPRIEAERVGKPTGKPLPASIIAVEPTLNFAILKIEASKDLKASKICPRDKIVVGMPVYALADSSAKNPKYSAGKITDLNSMECYQESMTATMLQAAVEVPDAALGGPVFNGKGQVVAVHTGYRKDVEEVHSDAAIGPGKIHLLPIFLVFNIYESVKLKGNMKSPWTGFSVRTLTEQEQTIFPQGRFRGGVAIDYVWSGSPADKLGIQKDDILVGFSYYPTKTVAAFQKWLYMYGVGFKVKLHVLRDQTEYFSVDYTIEERPDSASPR